MALVPAICTQCGASIEVDDSHDAAICRFCGTPFIVEKAINRFNINNTINANTVIVQNTEKEFDIRGGILSKYLGREEIVIIPDEVYEIADSCFEGTYIKRVVFNQNIKKIGKRAFANCSNLGEVDTSKCLKYEVGDSAFEGCAKLLAFDLTKATYIGIEAFKETSLHKIKFPTHHINVGARAFCNCKKMKQAIIGDDFSIVGDDERTALFDGCDLLLDIQSSTCKEMLDTYNEYGNFYSNDQYDKYCNEQLGVCMFSRFFIIGGGWIPDIYSKKRFCVFCHGNIRSVKDGFLKSHLECSECKRLVPTYKEVAEWINDQ